MAQALEGKPTKQTAPSIDTAIDKLERYAFLLEEVTKIVKGTGKEPVEAEALANLLLELSKKL